YRPCRARSDRLPDARGARSVRRGRTRRGCRAARRRRCGRERSVAADPGRSARAGRSPASGSRNHRTRRRLSGRHRRRPLAGPQRNGRALAPRPPIRADDRRRRARRALCGVAARGRACGRLGAAGVALMPQRAIGDAATTVLGARAALAGPVPTFDLVVIGGGINGAGIARAAALAGYTVCLLEARDFGWGTTWRSTKLIHGGLRYLEHAEFGLVFES